MKKSMLGVVLLALATIVILSETTRENTAPFGPEVETNTSENDETIVYYDENFVLQAVYTPESGYVTCDEGERLTSELNCVPADENEDSEVDVLKALAKEGN